MIARLAAAFALVLVPASVWVTGPLQAQGGRRFHVAAGPALSLAENDSWAGGHVRLGATLARGSRPVNLQFEGYFSALRTPETAAQAPVAAVLIHRRELQWGVAMSAVFTILPRGAVAPFILLGGIYRSSSIRRNVRYQTLNIPYVGPYASRSTATAGDILLGGGLRLRAGSRHFIVETRLVGTPRGSEYSGVGAHASFTIGVTF